MREMHFEVVGYKVDTVHKKWFTLFLLQVKEEIEKNNKNTTGRMAINVPMRYVEDASEYPYKVGDVVRVGFSMKYKHFYVIPEEKKGG